MKITIITTPESGKIKRNRQTLIDALKHFDGKEIKISVERNYDKRSNKQNSYHWGVLIPLWRDLIRQEMGEIHTPESTHEQLKDWFGFKKESVNLSTGEVLYSKKRTRDYTTQEMKEFQEMCRQKALEMFDAYIPEPNEKLELNL
jgi:hypothetical protein